VGGWVGRVGGGGGGLVTRRDLLGYEARWSEPAEVLRNGHRILTRAGLSGLPSTLERLRSLRDLDSVERALALLEAIDARPDSDGHTTNTTIVDRDGNACVLTTSLGLGSGDFLPGLDLHLNSMLGEVDLLRGPLDPGGRMPSMMAPSLAFDGSALALAAGSAGGTRLRTALVSVLAAILDEDMEPQAAVDRPRLHPVEEAVN